MVPATKPAEPGATEDSRLVEAVLRKDRKATAQLVALYADPIYAYLHQRLVPRTDLADDLLQEVFLAAWKSLKSFRGQSSLKSWLLAIARHKVEDHYRQRLREPEPITGDDGDPPPELAFEPRVDEKLDRRRMNDDVQRVLNSLPENYSAALLWRYWEKCPAKEMAARTGKSVKAIERLLARARLQFKRRWQDEQLDA